MKRHLYYIDLFCGAGGTSTGVENAQIHGEKCADVIACVNHDPHAIESHAANHPRTLHFTEDIRTLELSPLVEKTTQIRESDKDAVIVLWASLECTNFSKAKGGQPRDADSRTLAEHLFRYIDAIDPDYIQIENVEEFMAWGDVDENGHPISMDKGRKYTKWCNDVKKRGYDFQHRLLNAADYGAYTSRKRFFGIFAKKGLPIVFPRPTYSKNGGVDLFDNLNKWKPVREVLDLADEGVSIFEREKPLCEKTLERIYAGLIKFVAGGKNAFLVKYNSMNKNNRYTAPGIDEPCPTVATQNRLGIAKVQFLSKQFSGDPAGKNISIDEPSGTITCKDHHALATAQFISEYYGGADHNHSLDVPATTVTTRGRHAIVKVHLLDEYYGNGHTHSINTACPTLVTKDRFALITGQFLDMQYGNGTPTSIEAPAGVVTTNPKHTLVSPKWIMNTSFNNVGSSLDDPSPVVTANHKWHYLMNPQFKSAGGSVDKPCFTLIARMDKMPPYLMTTEAGDVAIAVFDSDSPMTRKIKEFMALYGIVDIKMRMLKVKELKRIMGFPEDYVLVGTQAEQKKYIGNAVEVNMARVLCETLYNAIAS